MQTTLRIMTKYSIQSNTASNPGAECGNSKPGFFLPLNLATAAIQSGKTHLIPTLLRLKSPSGWTIPNHKAIAAQTGTHPRTIKNHIRQLHTLGWINIDTNTGKVYPHTLRSGTRIHFEGNQPEKLRHAILLALITLWNRKCRTALRFRKKHKLRKKSEHEGGIAGATMGKKCNRSRAWAMLQQRQLKQSGHLQVLNRYWDIEISQDELLWLRANDPEAAQGLTARDGKVVQCLANVLNPLVSVRFQHEKRRKEKC